MAEREDQQSQSDQRQGAQPMLSPILATTAPLSRSDSRGNVRIPVHLAGAATLATPVRNLGATMAAAAQPPSSPSVSQQQQSQPPTVPPSQPVISSLHLNQRPGKAGMSIRLYLVAYNNPLLVYVFMLLMKKFK